MDRHLIPGWAGLLEFLVLHSFSIVMRFLGSHEIMLPDALSIVILFADVILMIFP
jgi:hypothetical protein